MITDWEKAVFVAQKVNAAKGGYKLSPEDILGLVRSSNELDYYYQGFKSEITVKEYLKRIKGDTA